MSVEYVTANEGQHVLVTMPDGYRVWPVDPRDNPLKYFSMIVDGIGEHGEPVTVSGRYIARVSNATVTPKAAAA